MRVELALQPLPERPTDPEPEVIEMEADWAAVPSVGAYIQHGDDLYVVTAVWWDTAAQYPEVMAKAIQ